MGVIIRYIHICVAATILFTASLAHAGQLTTQFNANNGQAGNMFDVDVLGRPLTVTDLEINIRNGNRTLNIYYRTGTWVGNENSQAGWTLHSTQTVVGQGNNNITSVDIPDLQLNANTTYGFYVTLTNNGMRYTNGTAVGAIAAFNGDLVIREGAGKSWSFGTTFQPRIWNGSFIYEIYDATITKNVDISSTSTANELLTYTIEVENTGDANLTGIAIADQLAQGSSSISLTTTGPTTDIGTIGALDPGETWEFTATHNITAAEFADGRDLVNTATLNANELSANYASDSATTALTANASLDLVKTAQLLKAPGNIGLDAEVGDTINYTYQVLNDGNLIISNVDIADVHSGSDPLPDPSNEIKQ